MIRFMTLGGVITIAVSVSLLVLLLTTGEPRRLTNASVEWALERATGVPVRIGGSSGSPLFGLEIHQIEVAPENENRFEIGRVRIDLDSISPLSRDVVLRRVELEGVRIDGHRDARGRWTWSAGELELGGRSEPTAQGTTQPVRVEVRDFRLDDARPHLTWARPSDVDGSVEARLDAQVEGFAWPIDPRLADLPATRLSLRELTVDFGALSVDRGQIDVRGDAGTYALVANDLSGPLGTVPMVRAELTLAGMTHSPGVKSARAEAEIANVNPALLAGTDGLDASVNGRLDFAWDGARGDFDADLGPSTFAAIPIDSGTARGSVWVEDERVHYSIEELALASELASVVARARGRDRLIVDASVHVEFEDLAHWPVEIRPAWLGSGRAVLDASGQGPWKAIGGEIELRVEEAKLAGVAVSGAQARVVMSDPSHASVVMLESTFASGNVAGVRSKQPFTVERQDRAVTIADAKIEIEPRQGRSSEIVVDGTLSSSRADGLRMGVQRLDLGDLIGTIRLADAAHVVGGDLDATLEIDGPWSEPLVVGAVDWRSPRVDGFVADQARVELTASGVVPRQRFDLAVGTNGEPALEARGAFSTRGALKHPGVILADRSLTVDLTLRAIDAATLAPLAGISAPLPEGRVSGRARIGGPLRFPLVEAEIEGRALMWRELPSTDVAVSLNAAEVSGHARLRATATIAEREALSLQVETADRARLAEPYALATQPGTRASLALDRFDLAWLDVLSSRLGFATQGTARGDLRLESGAIPQARGSIAIDGLTLSGPGIPFEIDPMPARVDFGGTVARSSELRVESKRGEAALRGQVSWQDPTTPTLTVRARASEFEIDVPGVLVGRFDGDAVVEGPVMNLEADGNFSFYRAMIELPDPRDPIMREIRIRQRAVSASPVATRDEDEAGIYEALSGEIGLTIGESVWLRGLGAELELRGQLAVRKEKGDPAALYGSVEVSSGRVEVQGRWLRVTSGSAIFDGSADPDPFVDATARHRVGDVTILVRLVGRASALDLEIESEPPLPVEDQLSYLLFDRPAADISAEEARSVSAAAMAASEMMLGQVGTELGREVGLDRVRLGVDEDDTPFIEVERRVHDRVALRYGRSLSGAGGGDRFVIEWRLFRELFLSGEQQTDGESALDLFWRRDF